MNTTTAKEYFLTYWKYAAMLILAILLFNQCNRTTGLILDADTHKANADLYLQKNNALQLKLKGVTTKYDLKIDSIVKVDNGYKLQLSQNATTTEAKLGDLKRYSASQITQYYKERYSAPNDVFQVSNGTTLKDTVSKKVISDLVVGDGAKAEVVILRDVVKTKDVKFTLCSTTVDSLKVGIEKISANYEKANYEKDLALADVVKAFKRERRKKNLWKVITGGVIAGAGYLLFVK